MPFYPLLLLISPTLYHISAPPPSIHPFIYTNFGGGGGGEHLTTKICGGADASFAPLPPEYSPDPVQP